MNSLLSPLRKRAPPITCELNETNYMNSCLFFSIKTAYSSRFVFELIGIHVVSDAIPSKMREKNERSGEETGGGEIPTTEYW